MTEELLATIEQLKEENETLKDNVEFLHSCLDDRDKSIAIMQEENKKLKHENSYRAGIVDILPKGKGHIAEETIQDLQKRIDELLAENKKLKEIIRKNVNGCPYGGLYCGQYLGL